MKKLLTLSLVLLLGVTCMAKTNYFDDLYIGGDVTVVGTVTFADLDIVGDLGLTGNAAFDGTTMLFDGSTSVRNVSAAFTSQESPANRLGLDATYYTQFATAITTGITTVTMTGNAPTLTWTANSFDWVGSTALDDTLISTSLGIGTDITTNGTTGTHDWFLTDSVVDALSIQRGTTDFIVLDTSTVSVDITGDLDANGALMLLDGSTSFRGVSAAFTSLESPANRLGFNATEYMQIATAVTTGITTITHTGNAPAVTWTANSFDLVGDIALDAITAVGNLSVDGTTAIVDGSTSVRGVSAGFVSLESPANRFGLNATEYMQVATTITSGITTITHTGNAPTVTWTANSFDFVGAMAMDAVTLSDVLTFSDAATIDNSGADTLTLTEVNVAVAGAFSSTGLADLNGGIAVDTSNFTVDGSTGTIATAADIDVQGADITNSVAGVGLDLAATGAAAGTGTDFVQIDATVAAHLTNTPTDRILDINPTLGIPTVANEVNIVDVSFATPVYVTAVASTVRGIYFDPTIGAATLGTNNLALIDVAAIGDSDNNVNIYGIRMGAMTGAAGTENAIDIGAGWDLALKAASPVSILDDQVLTLGTTTATAETKITMEFDETTTGVGSFVMGSSGVPQVLIANPGSAVIPFSVNILHSAGAGNCDDLIAGYMKAAISGNGDADTTIVGGAYRAYVGTTLGTTVVDEAYGIQPWAKHDGTGAITALSGVSALVDVNTDNFTATTVNAAHLHIEGAATVTSSMFDGMMIEVYPDVTNLDAGLRIAVDTGATVADGIAIVGVAGDGIDMSGATLTNDIVLQNGETISNATDGELDFSSASLQVNSQPVVLNTRHRVTTAEINSGHEVLPAITGRAYRVVDVKAIAYGGAVGTTTTVDVLGTQGTGSVKLVTFAQADLIQSAILTIAADGTVLADGASFAACDAATAITVGKTGGDADTATGVDFIITYVIE